MLEDILGFYHVFQLIQEDSKVQNILDSNPNAVGTEFSTFTNGKKGKIYESGDRKKQYLKIQEETDLILNDWYWSKENYVDWIANTGFQLVKGIEPTIDSLSQEVRILYEEKYKFNEWGEERNKPPFIIYKSVKTSN